MVEEQLERRGISEPRVLAAFSRVPRHLFVPCGSQELAYHDAPLPIGYGQTISQPYVVALTVSALGLTGEERVLEIGTGSGYGAAVLACLAKEVFTVERLGPLAAEAADRLKRLGYANVHVAWSDGARGWKEQGPYSAIAVTAAAPGLPPDLLAQLAMPGRLVMPIEQPGGEQVLTLVVKNRFELAVRELAAVRFVPLVTNG